MTEAFKQASITVSTEEEKSEDQLLEEIRRVNDLLKSYTLNDETLLRNTFMNFENIDSKIIEEMVRDILSKEDKCSDSINQ